MEGLSFCRYQPFTIKPLLVHHKFLAFPWRDPLSNRQGRVLTLIGPNLGTVIMLYLPECRTLPLGACNRKILPILTLPLTFPSSRLMQTLIYRFFLTDIRFFF